jgi:hypothetical protein
MELTAAAEAGPLTYWNGSHSSPANLFEVECIRHTAGRGIAATRDWQSCE